MLPTYFPGGQYADATLKDHVVLVPGQRLITSRGDLARPAGGDVLHLRCEEIVGRLFIAGQGHDDGLAWLHNQQVWNPLCPTYGTSTCAFGPLGLYVSTPGTVDNIRVFDVQTLAEIMTLTKPLGVRGIAMVTGAGTSADDIHSVDAWYGQGGLGEFDQIADGLRVGEGASGGLDARDGDGPLAMLEPGSNRFVRARLYGTTIVAAAWQEDRRRAVVLRLDRSELPGLAAAPVVVAIGRDQWVGFFAGSLDAEPAWATTIRPQTLLGNCYLKVAGGLVYTMSGVPLAQYVAAEAPGQVINDEIAKARARHPGLPVIPYWTRQNQTGPVPAGDWIGVEAYRQAAESIEDFEARLHAAVTRCPQVMFIPQCYTSNANNTPDLASIVPVVARVALAHGQVKGSLVFSGSGRATGLQDHPEVRPLWEQLVAGVTTPQVTVPQNSPMIPKITITSYSPTVGQAPLRVRAVAAREEGSGPVDRYKWLFRQVGTSVWTLAADNPADDDDHTYTFAVGNWEIALQGVGPGGTAQTQRVRRVSVSAVAPAPTPDPVPTPVPTPAPSAPTLTGVSFQASDGRYFRSDWALPGNRIVADRATAGPGEQFDVRRAPDGRIGLRSSKQLWVSAEQNFTLTASREKPDDFVPTAWEAFEVVPFEDGIALKSDHGLFVRALGGKVVADQQVPVKESKLVPSVPLTSAPSQPGQRRSGIVRPDGRAVRDDGGLFHPFGFTFFWAMQGWKHERDHFTTNAEWLASRADYVRILTEVGWAGREIDPSSPAWSDWGTVLRELLDYLYNERGLRVELTLIGKGTNTDPLQLTRDVATIIGENRQHMVMDIECCNEYYLQGGLSIDTMQRMARVLRADTPNLVALSSPGDEGLDLLKAAALAAGANAYTMHPDRGAGYYKWRQVRQPYDFKEVAPLVGFNNEPAGPGSSVATQTNPLQLAMLRAVGVMCGGAGYVFHTGTGVFGDGKPHPTAGPRPANFAEIDHIDAMVAATRGVADLLPEGVENWRVANTGWTPPNPVAPFQPHAYWDSSTGDGVNKAYAALAPDGRVIQMPCGVRGHVALRASYPLRDVVVYDPVSRQSLPGLKTSFDTNEILDLPGGGEDAMVAYIIHGHR